MDEQEKLQILKKLLFTEEKELTDSIVKKVEELQNTIYRQKELSHKVDPIIEQHFVKFVNEIPTTLGPTITEALKEEISKSQDAVVEALYPILGKMIKKYIAHEIKLLSENISRKTKQAFSLKNWFASKRAQAKGVSNGDLALSNYGKPQLLQLLVIKKESGILISEFSPFKEEVIDKEMIAGMLTAIKSFVEDAFSGGNQELETIEYELYRIHIQNFYSYYIAAVIAGAYTLEFKDRLEDAITDFAKNHISNQELVHNHLFSEKLKKYFTNEVI
ncbi:cell envelope biogenesis protein OmpA [Aquimarina sp. ERC-38]|uniref:cell envelope biogenesis protein OmpA n=1 Tax=Aquimarina sp. ERC-38 TaxID=2949996 RepID=UPI002246184D|nr:cell envelope biogenesis protein OmpA [Aquimarina sp. ERC-38]UZO81956.1 cell envelope biogenesis protein OmpA [Aquimarina sp. ERC-38]